MNFNLVNLDLNFGFNRKSLDFTLNRFLEKGYWKIRILHPNRTIHKCSVYLENIPLQPQKTDNGQFEYTIEEGGGCNFTINDDYVKDKSKVVIKSDGKTIKKLKFMEIEKTNI